MIHKTGYMDGKLETGYILLDENGNQVASHIEIDGIAAIMRHSFPYERYQGREPKEYVGALGKFVDTVMAYDGGYELPEGATVVSATVDDASMEIWLDSAP